jgi:hypothetical protein
VSLDFRQDRPAWLRALNAGGRALEALGLRSARLEVDELTGAALRRTGLSDFFGDEFRAPLARLVESLNAEARLTPVGRALARQDILVALSNRLQMADWFRRHPEIGEQPLVRPLFITGLPRSGTSILHELLAQDPAHRVPLSWEVRYCCPPPDGTSHASDPRVRRAHRDLTLWHVLVPAYKTMHEMGGRIPCECGDITMNTFLGDRFMALHQVPGYAAWASGQDMRPVYAFHRRMLQILQWRLARERWVLKAPAHMNWLPALLAVYPDACIVQTHRDPLQVMGSVASLLSAILWMRSDDVDPRIIEASFGGEALVAQLEGVMRLRDSGALDPAQLFDVRYTDLMSDPWGTIAAVYEHFGLELGAAARARMERYLAHKPRGKFGRHEYSFGDLGLDLATERERFARYQERYGVKSEVT